MFLWKRQLSWSSSKRASRVNNLISLLVASRASLAQVNLDDVGRYKALDIDPTLLLGFPHYQKAVYLCGDFGVGKNMIWLLWRMISPEKRSVSTTPATIKLCLDVRRNAVPAWSRRRLTKVKTAQIADFGWYRCRAIQSLDEGWDLQVIPQHRMQEKVLTFFYF